jgi:hypothetical protein
VELVKQRLNKEFQDKKHLVTPFVADLAKDDLTKLIIQDHHNNSTDSSSTSLRTGIPAGSIDVATCIFVLSALTPSQIRPAITHLSQILKPGTGKVVLRDYAAGDMAGERLGRSEPRGSGRRARVISPNFFLRGDGTQALYFDKEELKAAFEAGGFICDKIKIHNKVQVNRKTGVVLERRWLQAEFIYNGGDDGGTGGENGKELVWVRQHEEKEGDVLKSYNGHAEEETLTSTSLDSNGNGMTSVSLWRGPAIHIKINSLSSSSSLDKTIAAASLLLNPLHGDHLCVNKRVLELCGGEGEGGGGGLGLISLAAVYGGARVALGIASSEVGVEVMRENMLRNGHLVVFERLRVQQMGWRNGGRRREGSGGSGGSSMMEELLGRMEEVGDRWDTIVVHSSSHEDEDEAVVSVVRRLILAGGDGETVNIIIVGDNRALEEKLREMVGVRVYT